MNEHAINWHPAFVAAVRLELGDYRPSLTFIPEFQLSSAPLRIDLLVIRKKPESPVLKNFAAIFKGHNIFEYKSPAAYLSVFDFYKTYGYACFYSALNKVPVTDITLSFVVNHRPQRLLKHLGELRKWRVEEGKRGIYSIEGDIMPIQVLVCHELPEGENRWFTGLREGVEGRRIRALTEEILAGDKVLEAGAYLEAVIAANVEKLKEMGRMTKKLGLALEEMGILPPKWQEKLRQAEEAQQQAEDARQQVEEERRRLEDSARLLRQCGVSIDAIVKTTGLSRKRVKQL
ncbi:MAG: hypothetical protein LBR93_11110 [Treponema sp.]|jgi:hypothetical protein|nr:hypothetical protein [Treponema sp.]